MDPTKSEMSLAEMDYKGAFSKGRISFLVPLVLNVSVFRISVSLKEESKTQIWLCLLYSNKWYFEHVTVHHSVRTRRQGCAQGRVFCAHVHV